MNAIITIFGIEVSDSDVIDSKRSIPSENGDCRLIAEDEPEAGHWLKILGGKLADHLRENGAKIYKEVLLTFPKGYNLYCHTMVSDDGKRRNNTYLCGVHKFYSPNEFASHLIWLATGRSAPCKCIHCQGENGVAYSWSSPKKSGVASELHTRVNQVTTSGSSIKESMDLPTSVDNLESTIPSSPSTVKSDDSQEILETASTMQSLVLSPEHPEAPLQESQPEITLSLESPIIPPPPFEEIEEPPSPPSSHVNKSSTVNKGLKRTVDDESLSKPDEGMKKVKPLPTTSISCCKKNQRKGRPSSKGSSLKKSNQYDRPLLSRRTATNKRSTHRVVSALKLNRNEKSHHKSRISKSSQRSSKANVRPKKIQAEYRSGEIVWVCLSKTRNHELSNRINEASNDDEIPIEYWPGVIYSLNKVGDFVNFKVKLVVLGIVVDVRRNVMKPWKAYDPEISEELFQEVICNKNHDHNSLTINENINDYVRAVHRTREASKTYSPMKAYWPNEVDNDRKPIYEINSEQTGLSIEKDFAHYEYILFGAERIQEGDLVRLVPENSMHLDGEPEFPEFLEIKEIYDHRSEGIKLTGNILQRGELLNPDGPYKLEDYKWWISDEVDELFTVDLEDIAGRFYLMMPHVTKRTIARTPKDINDRMSIIESGTDLEKSANTGIKTKQKRKHSSD